MNWEKVKQKWSILKWMYMKYSKWLPVVYTPFQDIEAFISIYCKANKGLPILLNAMMKEIESELLSQEKWELSERQKLEITIKAGRQANKIRNFFWDTVKKVNDNWSFPFVIRARHLDKE